MYSTTTSTAPKHVTFRRTSIEMHEYETPATNEGIDRHSSQAALLSEKPEQMQQISEQEQEAMILENASRWQILLSLWKKWLLHVPLFMPLVTLAQIAFLTAVLVLNGFEQFEFNPMVGPSQSTLLQYGAKNSNLIFSSYTQLWRFFSCVFLQAGIIHLIVNSLWQLIFGIRLELFWGPLRVAAIYLMSGWGSQLLSVVLLPSRVGTGSTSAIAGLLGAIYADYNINFKSNPYLLTGALSMLWQTFLLFATTTTIPFVGDNFSTVAGLYIGFAVGLIVLPRGFMDTAVTKRKFLPAIFYPRKSIIKELDAQEEKEEQQEKQRMVDQQQKRVALFSLHVLLGHVVSRAAGVVMLVIYFAVVPGLYWGNIRCTALPTAPFYSPCWYLSPNWYNLLGVPNQAYPTTLLE